MYKLIIQDDEGKTTVVPLIRDEITIGRKEGNTIRLTERNVSRRHARIVKANGGSVVVEDLDSYNGVKVNGTRIQGRVAVNESDRIQIGDYLLELKMERGAGDPYNQGQPPGPGGYPQGGMATAPPLPMSMQATPAMGSVPVAGMMPGSPSPHQSNPGLGAMSPLAANGGVAARAQATKTTAPMAPYVEPGAQVAAMGTPAPELGAGADRPGRIVVVSSNFGGREYLLDKPAMVIGRTDDNDIVINHRSISRHHAKIVLEQGRYCIVDMQSSNGVRVNGEDYGKVELRRGDMIDLGHVRLRYVDPGEDFVFDRDAQLVDVNVKSGRGKGALIAGLSAITVAAVVAVVFVTGRGNEKGATAAAPVPATVTSPAPTPTPTPTPTPVAVAPRPVTDSLPPPAPEAPTKPVASAAADAGAQAVAVKAPVEPPPAAPDPARDTAKLLAEAQDAMAAEKWVAAISASDQVLKIDPANADAKKTQEKANAEFRNQTIYEKLVAARDAGAGKAAEVARLAREIPADSVYKAKAEADLAKLHDQFVHEREADAKNLAARGQCDKINALAKRSAEVFPDARAAVEKAGQGCTPIAAKAPVEPSERPPAVPTPTSAPSEAELLAMVADAKEAARNNNWAEARDKSDHILRIRPNDPDALAVGGIAACNLLDRERATRYIARLKGQRQIMIKQICAGKGLLLE